MDVDTWDVPTRSAKRVGVAVKHRYRGEDLILFTHGLGCAKESFDGAFEAVELKRYSICTFDFPAHGQSGDVASGGDIAALAEVTRALIARLSPKRLFLVCHSMGGAVGVVAAQDLANVVAFVSVEGNLVGEDCGLVSRGIAHQSAEQFVRAGFPAYVESLAASTDASLVRWAQWYARCRPYGIHQLARSLVEWCDSDKLIEMFSRIRPRAYVRGEHSDVDHLAGRLRGTPVHTVASSGHFPMLDNPDEFYALIGDVISRPDIPTGAAASVSQPV